MPYASAIIKTPRLICLTVHLQAVGVGALQIQTWHAQDLMGCDTACETIINMYFTDACVLSEVLSEVWLLIGARARWS